MPEPNLPPLVLDDSDIEAAANSMPELLDDIYERFTAPVGADGSAGAKPSYNLSPYDASVLVGEPNAPAFFEVVASGRDPKLAANWVTSELWGRLHAASTPLAESPVTAERLGCMLDLIETGTISGKIGVCQRWDRRDGRLGRSVSHAPCSSVRLPQASKCWTRCLMETPVARLQLWKRTTGAKCVA